MEAHRMLSSRPLEVSLPQGLPGVVVSKAGSQRSGSSAPELSQEFATLTRELSACREQLLEREEEISELKAERNNTRLLLEHLECLVSRHERSLRMTVVKRQAQSPSGVSSEVEVLKALKSLFEHHKALDEKVRERLRAALERVATLEEQLASAHQQVTVLQQGPAQREAPVGEDEKRVEGKEPGQKILWKRLPNGSIHPNDEASRVVELQELLEKQNFELVQAKERLAGLVASVAELEEDLGTARKDLIKSEELSSKYQRDLREALAQKDDMEERITTLEKRYLAAQREATSIHDLNDKLENELANKESLHRQCEEKARHLQELLELAEQKLQQTMRKAETLPEVEAELAQRIAALTKAEERHGSIEEHLRQLESQLEEKNQELARARQREKMNEEHNKRLSDTVDRLLSESNERLQLHLKERMAALEEKAGHKQSRFSVTRYYPYCGAIGFLPGSGKIRSDQATSETASRPASKAGLLLLRGRAGGTGKRRSSSVLAQNLRDRSHVGSATDLRYPLSTGVHAPAETFGTPPGLHRPQKGRFAALREEAPKDWEQAQPGGILATVSHAFDSDPEISDVEEDDREALFSSMDVLSPSGHSDAQTLAIMLQEQLDAINEEIRMIQEEKESTELRAEELETRVTTGSMEGLNLMQLRKRASIPTSLTALSLASSSPPVSGRSTPKLSSRSAAQDLDRMGIMTLPSDLRKHRRKLLSPAARDENREDKTTIKCETSPPSSPRTLRLEKLGHPALSLEDGKSSLEEQTSNLSSSTSSQDSLHKGSKRKGIKSSIGRLFGKKEKGRLIQLSRDGATGHGTSFWKMLEGKACPLLSGMDRRWSLGWRDPERERHQHPPSPAEIASGHSGKGVANKSFGSAHLEDEKDDMRHQHPPSPAEIASGHSGKGVANKSFGSAHLEDGFKRCLSCGAAIPSSDPHTSTSNSHPVGAGHESRFGTAASPNRQSHSEPASDAAPHSGIDVSHKRKRGRSPSSGPSSGNVWLTHEEMENMATSTKTSSGNVWLTHEEMENMATSTKTCILSRALSDVLCFPSTSLQYGIMCLKRLNYDRKELQRRREESQHEIKDVLVWTNDQVIHWIQSIGLREYANNLIESGVHGALLALDENFDHNSLALVLQIPTQNTQARQVMEREFNNLLALGTDRRLDDGEDKAFRRTPSWRKRFRPRDVHSIDMLSGSAATRPPRYPPAAPLPPPSAPLKKMPPEAHSHYLYGYLLAAFRD
ncbi:Liprin-alpha-2 [Chelonia mydas]|uniref:Liprin-alpha-2 n=1 Tax=Chelonia mydas TaxID=8469 RepID=M7AMT9_CHEMY|nr:Liprin-alpha-2 [Chelonia mydas]